MTAIAFTVALAEAFLDVSPFLTNFFLIASLTTLVCTANFLESNLDSALSFAIALATIAVSFLTVVGDATFANDALTTCWTFWAFFSLDDCDFFPRSCLNFFFKTFLIELAFLLASLEAALGETPCFVNLFFSSFLRLATFLFTILEIDFEVLDDWPFLTLLSRLIAFLTSDAFLPAFFDAVFEEAPCFLFFSFSTFLTVSASKNASTEIDLDVFDGLPASFLISFLTSFLIAIALTLVCIEAVLGDLICFNSALIGATVFFATEDAALDICLELSVFGAIFITFLVIDAAFW